MEKIFSENLQLPIDHGRLTLAFGSVELARAKIDLLRSVLRGPDSVIFLHGSFATGACANKLSPHYAGPIDQNRKSDLDLGVVDYFLFRDLPSRELISGLGKSHGLTYPDGKIKDYLKKGSSFRILFQAIKEIQDLSGRGVDIKIYKDFSGWLSCGKNYYLLADSRTVCF